MPRNNIHMKCAGPNGEKLKTVNEKYKPRLDGDDKQRSPHSFILSLSKYFFSIWNVQRHKG